MVVQKTPYLQYRTFDEIYLFQAKNDITITLKVYSIYRELVSKTSLHLLLPKAKDYFITGQVKPLLNLFKEQRIISLPSNSNTFIPTIFQNKDFIPTFHYFEREDSDAARTHFREAVEYSLQENNPKAFMSYAHAFRYTNRWEDYEKIIPFLTKINDEKAMVARLYLVKYQLEAGQIDQASRTLEKCFALGRDNRFLHVNVLNCPRKYKAEDYHNAFFLYCHQLFWTRIWGNIYPTKPKETLWQYQNQNISGGQQLERWKLFLGICEESRSIA